jgi:lipopolysaccharide cholinephosphotransferase
MNDMQSKLLEMMEWFHCFCMKHDIKYYALGGTALGAVRHNGFIPWDDDIDVGMPRLEYNRLISLMKTENNSNKYLLETPLENRDFVYPISKLYDTTTTLIENTRYKTKRGIFIDIFPLDGIGNTYEESLVNFKQIEKKLDFVRTRVCAINTKRAFYKNFAIILGRCIPKFISDWQKTMQQAQDLCEERAYADYEYIVNSAGAWREKEIIKKEYFGQPVLCKFESLDIYIPENADKYLTCLYGNYMQLPPKEKQVTHHDYLYLDLEKGYMEN